MKNDFAFFCTVVWCDRNCKRRWVYAPKDRAVSWSLFPGGDDCTGFIEDAKEVPR